MLVLLASLDPKIAAKYQNCGRRVPMSRHTAWFSKIVRTHRLGKRNTELLEVVKSHLPLARIGGTVIAFINSLMQQRNLHGTKIIHEMIRCLLDLEHAGEITLSHDKYRFGFDKAKSAYALNEEQVAEAWKFFYPRVLSSEKTPNTLINQLLDFAKSKPMAQAYLAEFSHRGLI